MIRAQLLEGLKLFTLLGLIYGIYQGFLYCVEAGIISPLH